MEFKYPLDRYKLRYKRLTRLPSVDSNNSKNDNFPFKVPDCTVSSPLFDMYLDCFIKLLDMPFALSMRNTVP